MILLHSFHATSPNKSITQSHLSFFNKADKLLTISVFTAKTKKFTEIIIIL